MHKQWLMLIVLFSMNNYFEAADLKMSPFMLQMLGGALAPSPFFAHPMFRSVIDDMQSQFMQQAIQSERKNEAMRLARDVTVGAAKKIARLCFYLAKWLALNWPAVLGSTLFIGAGVAYNAYNLTRLRAEMAMHRRETEQGFVDAQADRERRDTAAHTHRERIASASSSALEQAREDRERRHVALSNQITESAGILSQALAQAQQELERIIEQQAGLARSQQVEEMQEQLAALEEMFSRRLGETQQAMLGRFDTLQQTVDAFEKIGLVPEVALLREKLDKLQREFIAPLTVQIGGASRRLAVVEREVTGIRSDTAALLEIARGSAGGPGSQATVSRAIVSPPSLAVASSSSLSLMTHFGNNAPFTSAIRHSSASEVSSRLLTDQVAQDKW